MYFKFVATFVSILGDCRESTLYSVSKYCRHLLQCRTCTVLTTTRRDHSTKQQSRRHCNAHEIAKLDRLLQMMLLAVFVKVVDSFSISKNI